MPDMPIPGKEGKRPSDTLKEDRQAPTHADEGMAVGEPKKDAGAAKRDHDATRVHEPR